MNFKQFPDPATIEINVFELTERDIICKDIVPAANKNYISDQHCSRLTSLAAISQLMMLTQS